MEPMGNREPLQQVGHQRGVVLGAGKDDAHLLERHAAGGLAQQPAHEGPHLGRFARRGDELHGAVAYRVPLRRLEQARA